MQGEEIIATLIRTEMWNRVYLSIILEQYKRSIFVRCAQTAAFYGISDYQPFNCNHLKPCPMLENPELLQQMVHETGAKSTDLQSPETVEHLCGKCHTYAKCWSECADKLWSEHPREAKGYQNYKQK